MKVSKGILGLVLLSLVVAGCGSKKSGLGSDARNVRVGLTTNQTKAFST